MENTENKPISMGALVNINNTSKIKIITVAILATVAVLSFVFLLSFYIKSSSNADVVAQNAKVINLSEVIVAPVPELKSIMFLDRKTKQVKFMLSDSLSTAVYALKSSETTTDYSASLKNKK